MTFTTRKAIGAFALFGAMAVPGIAFATTSAAAPGDYCTQPGCTQLRTPGDPGAGSQNGTGAGSGTFGFYSHGARTQDFGLDANGNPICSLCSSDPHLRHADGTQTGLNNSAVSGNRAGPGTQDAPRKHPVPQSG